MFKKTIVLALKDIKLTYRDRAAFIGSYLAPIMILIIFGVIYSGMSGGSGDIEIETIFVDQSQSEEGSRFLKNLETEDVFVIQTSVISDEGEVAIDEAMAREMILDGDAVLAVIYKGSEPMEDGFDVITRLVIKILYDPTSDMELQIAQGLIQKTAFMNFGPELPRDSFNWILDEVGESDSDVSRKLNAFMDVWVEQMEQADTEADSVGDDETESGGMANLMEGLINLETEEVVQEDVEQGNPFMANSVAGIIVLFLLFSVSYSAAALLKEQQEGTIKRLLLAPITVDSIVFGKFLSIGFNSLCQVFVMFVLTAFLFKVNIIGNIGPVIIMSLATVAAVTAFGMIIASLAKSYDQINASITVIVLSMSAVGGSMFPRILMPGWMQDLGLFTINGWAIDGYLDALYRYNGPESILGYGEAHSFMDVVHNSEALVLFIFAFVCGWVASKLFKKSLVSGG